MFSLRLLSGFLEYVFFTALKGEICFADTCSESLIIIDKNKDMYIP
jgi:hypothetical protein